MASSASPGRGRSDLDAALRALGVVVDRQQRQRPPSGIGVLTALLAYPSLHDVNSRLFAALACRPLCERLTNNWFDEAKGGPSIHAAKFTIFALRYFRRVHPALFPDAFQKLGLLLCHQILFGWISDPAVQAFLSDVTCCADGERYESALAQALWYEAKVTRNEVLLADVSWLTASVRL